MYELMTREILVRVAPEFMVEESAPEDDYYVWSYKVEIENCGTETIQLKTRQWQIIDASGKTEEIHGDGVVGENPVLGPGDGFEYSSGAPLSTPSGLMAGSYTVQTSTGELFEVRIPSFSLDSPHETRRLN